MEAALRPDMDREREDSMLASVVNINILPLNHCKKRQEFAVHSHCVRTALQRCIGIEKQSEHSAQL